MNRGYVLNDLHQPAAAASDFEAALKREPKNGEAHLGLAYASLDLHQTPEWPCKKCKSRRKKWAIPCPST